MDNMLEIILGASLMASQAIMAEYQKATTTITTKPDNSPVTPADMASHEIFKTILTQYYPGIPLVSEEDFDADKFPPADNYFLLDPLDGTKEFIKKSGEFSISLALIEHGRPTFGAIWQPTINSGYLGGKPGVYFYDGAGDMAAPLSDPAKKLQKISQPKKLPDVAIVVSPSDPYPERFEKILGKKITRVARRGSALKFFALLDGTANYYPRTAPSYEWDIAAGHALIAPFGGTLLPIDKNPAPLDGATMTMAYGKVGAKNSHFICAI
ncbi:MAG: inositol monophosphatase family protein [Hydrotalea sp.]|nr:inositol monophosphatase family protein [Hydrotalea sp.]